MKAAKKNGKRRLAGALAGLLAGLTALQEPLSPVRADSVSAQMVLTLGADLDDGQKATILDYFGIAEDQVEVLTITNQDERDQLGSIISLEEIGTHTYSCALVNPTEMGGIQVKTANMDYVTSNMIASALSTSGVYNCDVLAAAPFMVSGTGAMTGVMMAYEAASGTSLDGDKRELANEELVTTAELAEIIGQNESTLVVNDIKIRIASDQVKEEEQVRTVVDDVVTTTESAAAEAAAAQGTEVRGTLGTVEHEKLYSFGYKFSQQDYDYGKMQPTLERVTYNITRATGIDDPITDTFTTIDEDVLPDSSILMRTNDEAVGADANINATSGMAVEDRAAEPISVFSGEVTLTEAGKVRAKQFISGSNLVSFEDVNGSYALMDLNGTKLTDSVYSGGMNAQYGYIEARLDGEDGKAGILATDGTAVIDFRYDSAGMLGAMWAAGITVEEADADDYDTTGYRIGKDGDYYKIAQVDIYYLGSGGTEPVGTLTREQFGDYSCSGDYLNIEAADGTVTTYDSSFTAMQNPESLYDFGAYGETGLAAAVSDKTGYSVRSFRGSYAQARDDSTSLYGITDRYGNIIVPPSCDRVYTDFADESYESGGYFSAQQNDHTVFAAAGGTVTGDFAWDPDEYNSYQVRFFGMSAAVQDETGNRYVLLSGDGKESELSGDYKELSYLRGSGGMLYVGADGSSEDLIDWHGDVLLSVKASESVSSDVSSVSRYYGDVYSVSANGKYLIVQDGYTSSTLYMINDAEKVDPSGSALGAEEMQIETEAGASLEVYTGDPVLTETGKTGASKFVEGTDLLVCAADSGESGLSATGNGYALTDVTGKKLTEAVYSNHFEYDPDSGLILAYHIDGEQCGVLSEEGQTVIPFEYDHIEFLGGKWILAVHLKEADESDYDYYGYVSGAETYYQIDTARIYYLDGEDLSSVELTRDQIADAAADGDYLNVEDRTTGAVTTYDSTFTAVASQSYVSDFGDFSEQTVLTRQLEDRTGYYVGSFGDDGYVLVYSRGDNMQGIIDMNGEEIIPPEYDDVKSYSSGDGKRMYSANGYFCVEKDGKVGFVTEGGTVSCELKYTENSEEESFSDNGMSGTLYSRTEETYRIIAADGTESGPFESASVRGSGMFYEVYDGDHYSLADWHGNILIEDTMTVSVSGDGKYLLVQQYGEDAVLYEVDAAD